MADIMGTIKKAMHLSESGKGALKQYVILTEARKKYGDKENVLLEWKEQDALIQAWFPRNCVIYLSRLCEKGWSYAVDQYCYNKFSPSHVFNQ